MLKSIKSFLIQIVIVYLHYQTNNKTQILWITTKNINQKNGQQFNRKLQMMKILKASWTNLTINKISIMKRFKFRLALKINRILTNTKNK